MNLQRLSLLAGSVLCLALACSPAVVAQTAPSGADAKAKAVAPAVLPAKDFARRATVFGPRLSPDGEHLLVRMDDAEGKSHSLVVFRLSDMSVRSRLRMPINELPVDPTWVNDEWIVLEIGRMLGSLDQPINTGQVIASNITGDKQRYLFGYHNRGRRAATRGSDQAFGYIVSLPAEPNGHVYVRAEPWGRENLSMLYDIDVPKNHRHLLAKMRVGGMSFLVSPEGKATYAFGTNSDFEYVSYRRHDDAWSPLDPKATHGTFMPIAYTPDHKQLYAWVAHDDGPETLVRSSLDGKTQTVLAAGKFANITNIQWSAPPYQPFAAMIAAGKPQPVFIQPNSADGKLYRALQQVFKGKVVDFIDFSQDRGKLLFFVSSDRDPGSYYLCDTKTHKVTKLLQVAPWIKPQQMAGRTSVQFKASDGMELEGILTFPRNRPHENLPMVLMPHGGPHGVRDSWYFDWDAQFLANRGYLVLQVNYRGSGGRGTAFQEAGYRKWGTRIQQDLIDGVKWAIDKGYADKNRICVYGGSFGAYSAMMNVIRAPDLYQCAVGYAGIYDLAMMYTKGDIKTTDFGNSYLGTVIGRNEAELETNSPTHLAAKIKVPVLLVHGKEDQRAPFAQAEAMRKALEKAHKPFEWMAVDGEGHGFYTEEHRAAFLEKLAGFLDKYIGAGAAVAKPAAGAAPAAKQPAGA